MSVSINGTNGLTFGDATTQNTGGYTGFRNRIINGGMRIDQRNAGASVSVNSAAAFFAVDRFFGTANGGGVFSVQQSNDVPSDNGFTASLAATVTTADSSIAADDYYFIRQSIEGYNIADFRWGTAGAKTVTLSFSVKASIAGSYGGSLRNDAADRSYPFSFTIDNVNTWERKTIVVTGDISGLWNTTSGRGISISWSLGAGSNHVGTPGAWVNVGRTGATGQTNLIATNGATFYLTGVQLEKGSVATPFEFRPYGTELALCQWYCEVYVNGNQGSIPQYLSSVDVVNRPETALIYTRKRTSPSITLLNTNYTWLSAAATYPPVTLYLGTLTGTSETGAVLFFQVASGVTVNTLSAVGTIEASGDGKIIIDAELA